MAKLFQIDGINYTLADNPDMGKPGWTDAGWQKFINHGRWTNADRTRRTILATVKLEDTTANGVLAKFEALKKSLLKPQFKLVHNRGGSDVNKTYICHGADAPIKLPSRLDLNHLPLIPVDLEIEAQPLSLGAALVPSRNYIVDPTMTEDSDGDGVCNSFSIASSGCTSKPTVNSAGQRISMEGGANGSGVYLSQSIALKPSTTHVSLFAEIMTEQGINATYGFYLTFHPSGTVHFIWVPGGDAATGGPVTQPTEYFEESIAVPTGDTSVDFEFSIQGTGAGAAGAITVTNGMLTQAACYKGLLGVYQEDISLTNLTSFEAEVGRKMDLFEFFLNVGGGWPQAIDDIGGAGHKILCYLEPWDPVDGTVNQPSWTLASITSGAHDAALTALANTIKTKSYDVWLAPMAEFNGDWYPWCVGDGDVFLPVNGNAVADFIPAWQHIHALFTAQGVANVKWAWIPNVEYSINNAEYAYSHCYPGDAYVDYIGIDGFNWGTTQTNTWGSSWQSFAEIFLPSYKAYTGLSTKDILIASGGTTSQGGDKAQWITDMWVTLSQWTRAIGMVWFNAAKETNWMIEETAATLDAYIAGASSVRFFDGDGGKIIYGTETSVSPGTLMLKNLPGDADALGFIRHMPPDGTAKQVRPIIGMTYPGDREISDRNGIKRGYVYNFLEAADPDALGGKSSNPIAPGAERIIDLGSMNGRFLIMGAIKNNYNADGAVHLNLYGNYNSTGAKYSTDAIAIDHTYAGYKSICFGTLEMPLGNDTEWDWEPDAHLANRLGIATATGPTTGDLTIDNLVFMPLNGGLHRCETLNATGVHCLIYDSISRVPNSSWEYTPATVNFSVGSGGDYQFAQFVEGEAFSLAWDGSGTYLLYWATYQDYTLNIASFDAPDLPDGGTFTFYADVTFLSETGATRRIQLGTNYSGGLINGVYMPLNASSKVNMFDLPAGGVFSNLSNGVTFTGESGTMRSFALPVGVTSFTGTYTPGPPSFDLEAVANKGSIPVIHYPDALYLRDGKFIVMTNAYVNLATNEFDHAGSVISMRIIPRYT